MTRRLQWILTGMIALILFVACGGTPTVGEAADVSVKALTVDGNVSASTEVTEPIPVEAGDSYGVGAILATDSSGEALLELEDLTVFVLNPDSVLEIVELAGEVEAPALRFALNLGEVLLFHQGEVPAGASYAIETPNGTASIRGSSMGVSFINDLLRVICFTGSCIVESISGATETLTGGQEVEVDASGSISEVLLPEERAVTAGEAVCRAAQSAGALADLNCQEVIDSRPTPTATFTPSATPTNTSTPTPTATPTATFTPTPTATSTPVTEEAILGKWICTNCEGNKVGRFIEFVDTGSGLQHYIGRGGGRTEWVGPDGCGNIYVGYANCGVAVEGNSIGVVYRLLGSGFYTDYQFNLVYSPADDTITYTSAFNQNYPGDGAPSSSDISWAFAGTVYVRVEEE